MGVFISKVFSILLVEIILFFVSLVAYLVLRYRGSFSKNQQFYTPTFKKITRELRRNKGKLNKKYHIEIIKLILLANIILLIFSSIVIIIS